jgi:hypothetical protein
MGVKELEIADTEVFLFDSFFHEREHKKWRM